MRSLLAAGALLLTLCAGACSDGGGDSGQSCNDSEECTRWRCTCNDDSTPSISACIMGRCGDESLCTDLCENGGGVKSVEPVPSVAESPECDAFCAKAASLGCESSDCNRSFFCEIGPDECEEQVRAFLQCQVDTGNWSCSDHGWGVQSSCSKTAVTCP